MGEFSFLDKQVVEVNNLPLNNVYSDLNAGIVYDTFNAIGAIVTDTYVKVNNALTLGETLLTDMEMPTGWTSALDDVVIAAVPPIDLSIFPSMPSPEDLPGYETISWIAQDTSLTSYSSEMWATLIAKVIDGITNGGSGIPTAVETARHERNLERQRVANENLRNQSIVDLSSRCLSFPHYAMQALELQVAIEIAKQSHASSNEIEIFIGDLEQKNAHFMLDKAVVIEGLLRAFWKDFNSMKMEGVKATTDALIAHVEAITKEREGIVRLYEAEASVFKDNTQAQKFWYEAISEYQKAQLQKSALQLQKAESELKAKLDSFVAIKGLQEKIIATLGGTSSNVMASALNAENVSVGVSLTSGKSLTEQYSHSESKGITQSQGLGEDHNISHKGSDIT